MHYDFKFRFNKLDSQQNRNLLVPEVDRVLNEAAKLFVERLVMPNSPRIPGLTVRQHTKEAVRTLMKSQSYPEVTSNTVALPEDFWHYISATSTLMKKGCGELRAKVYVVDYGEEFQDDPLVRSSYHWQELNMTFFANSLKFHTDNTFDVKSFELTYYKTLPYFHYAEGYSASGYRLPSGTLLTGKANCELPSSTHGDIIDLAVYLATLYVQGQDLQLKDAKLKLGDIN